MIDIKLNNRKVGEANTPLEALKFIVENEKQNSYNPSVYDSIDKDIEEAINEYKDDSLKAEDLKDILYDAKLTKYSVEENLEMDILEKYTEYLNEEYPDRDFTNETFDLENLPIGVLSHEYKEEMIKCLFPKANGIPLSEKTNKILESMEETEIDIYVNAKTMKLNDVVDVPEGYFDDLLYPTDANHSFMASYFLEEEIDRNFSFESVKERLNTMKEIGAELLSPPQLETFPHTFIPAGVEIKAEDLKNIKVDRSKHLPIERGR